jgi:hypothetical protein
MTWQQGTVRVFQDGMFALEAAIGSHAGSLEASMRVTNGIPLGCSPASYRYHCKLCRDTEGSRYWADFALEG